MKQFLAISNLYDFMLPHMASSYSQLNSWSSLISSFPWEFSSLSAAIFSVLIPHMISSKHCSSSLLQKMHPLSQFLPLLLFFPFSDLSVVLAPASNPPLLFLALCLIWSKTLTPYCDRRGRIATRNFVATAVLYFCMASCSLNFESYSLVQSSKVRSLTLLLQSSFSTSSI